MSNYLPFQEEQSFQGATFKIDSPSKPKREFYSDDYNKKYINKKFYPEHKEITKRSELNTQNPSIYVEKSMHHQEIRLNDYDKNKIPPDWKMAEKHSLSRRATKEKKISNADVCLCCGYQVEREELSLCSDNEELKFLGSGFPLFYNYIYYCIIILIVLLISSGGFNLYTNYLGDFCTNEESSEGCKLNWMSSLSLPNKMNNSDAMEMQQNLNLFSCFLIILVLIFFRRSQRVINSKIDEQQNSVADYSIMVKNIPTNINSDYVKALTEFFSNNIDPVKKYNVTKVNLLWELDEIEEFKEKIDKMIVKKKNLLVNFKYDHENQSIKQCNESIEKNELDLDDQFKKIEKSPEYFAGMAFVSFRTEDEKEEVIKKSQASATKRIRDFLHGSRLHRQHGYYKTKNEESKKEGLFFHGFRLYISEAPEPNDINWESINSTNYSKILVRFKSYFLTFLLLLFGFGVIFIIKYYQSEYVDEADELLKEEDEASVLEAEQMLNLVEILNYIMAVAIILFNKIFVGSLIDKIVESEKISTQTRVNISFAHKLSLALFFNTALITFIIEVLISENYYHSGGLIFSEILICVVDVGFELLLWIIDPYSIIRYFKLNSQLSKGHECTLTQNEANLYMEAPNYSMSDRYADIIKTMWFVFMYATLIPLVVLLFLVGMILFYWIDKYNLYRRRTIKESISIELSTEMIEMLEMIMPIYGISNFVYQYDLCGTISWQSLVILGVGFIFAIIPGDSLNEVLFHVESKNEILNYEQVEADFDTDYDRENPVTKDKALKRWRELRERPDYGN